MKAGDTFRIPEPGTSLDSHLWVVISDPALDDNILIVNFTSFDVDSEKACILKAGEHPFVKHKTFVNYRGAKVVPKDTIERFIQKGLMTNHSPLSASLLKRIRDGEADSERMSLEHADILINQGLIEC